MQIRWEPGGESPLYQQLAAALGEIIRRGEIAYGEKLPTVRELTARLGVSPGTVQRAYEELAAQGAVRTVQGSGTFADFREEDVRGRKERAMAAIDGMLDTLRELNFSPREISVFLELKLRERLEAYGGVTLVMAEACPEPLDIFAGQLAEIESADVLSCLWSGSAAAIPEDAELIAVTEEHFEALRRALPEAAEKIVCVAAGTGAATAAALSRLPAGSRVGVVAASRGFAGRMARECEAILGRKAVTATCLLSESGELETLLQRVDAVAAPENYRRLAGRAQAAALAAFAREKPLIAFEYRLDRGSLLHLRELARLALEQKQSL